MLSVGMKVAAVPPALKQSRWHTVTSVEEGSGSGQLVALSGSRSIGSAQELAGKVLLASVESLPEDYALHDVDALLDREVVSHTYGSLGTITEILTGPANDVWVVDGPYGEVLLPVIDEVVRAIDAAGPLEVNVPDGLIPRDDMPHEGSAHAATGEAPSASRSDSCA